MRPAAEKYPKLRCEYCRRETDLAVPRMEGLLIIHTKTGGHCGRAGCVRKCPHCNPGEAIKWQT